MHTSVDHLLEPKQCVIVAFITTRKDALKERQSAMCSLAEISYTWAKMRHRAMLRTGVGDCGAQLQD